MANSASGQVASATVAIGWLLAGLRISRVPPSRADFHWPLMKRLAALITSLCADDSFQQPMNTNSHESTSQLLNPRPVNSCPFVSIRGFRPSCDDSSQLEDERLYFGHLLHRIANPFAAEAALLDAAVGH